MMFDTYFFFNDTATTEIYTLSLHDALPISSDATRVRVAANGRGEWYAVYGQNGWWGVGPSSPADAKLSEFNDDEERSEEHTSELQSRQYLVCRLLLVNKNKTSPDHAVGTSD